MDPKKVHYSRFPEVFSKISSVNGPTLYSAAMSRTIQEQLIEDHVSRNFDYGQEFRLKVSVDYRVYIFLSPKKAGTNLVDIVNYAKTLYGFEAFRLVHKREHIIHIYMRYQSAEFAKIAVEGFERFWDTSLHVASVSEMLEAMYAIESIDRTFPLWTSTIVDCVGEVKTTNPLAKENLSVMLSRFGDPRLYDFQWDGVRVSSAQALFSSMAEALGACIVLGQWVDHRNPCRNFHYRLRIVGGEKEMAIFKQLRIPNAKLVFDMEYFVGGEKSSRTVRPEPQVRVNNEQTPEFVYQHNLYQNSYQPMNPPAQRGIYQPMNPPAQRGTNRQQRAKRTFPRRQFNNRNAIRQNNVQIQPQGATAQQVPGGS